MVIYDIETDGLLDEATKVHCIVFNDVDTDTMTVFSDDDTDALPLDEVKDYLGKVDKLVCHNQVGFDLEIMRRFCGVEYTVCPDTLDGRPVEILDTLDISRRLWPDRPGGHGLDAAGRRLGVKKKFINDWSGLDSDSYIDRCKIDVIINTLLFKELQKEWKATYGSNI